MKDCTCARPSVACKARILSLVSQHIQCRRQFEDLYCCDSLGKIAETLDQLAIGIGLPLLVILGKFNAVGVARAR